MAGFLGMHNAIASSIVQIHRNILGDIKNKTAKAYLIKKD